jgi:hypothetical protein
VFDHQTPSRTGILWPVAHQSTRNEDLRLLIALFQARRLSTDHLDKRSLLSNEVQRLLTIATAAAIAVDTAKVPKTRQGDK